MSPTLRFSLACKVAGANGRSLGVHQDAGDDVEFLGHGPDIFDDGAHPVVGRMAHIEAEDIGAGLDEFFELFGRLGGGAEGADDFGFSHYVWLRSSLAPAGAGPRVLSLEWVANLPCAVE